MFNVTGLNGRLIEFERLIPFLESVDTPDEVLKRYKQAYTNTGELHPDNMIFLSGWHNLNGVMLSIPDKTSNSDYLVYPIVVSERSLKELLLAFPRQSVGVFHIKDKWIEERIRGIFEGESIKIKSENYFRGIKKGSHSKSEQRTITKRKDDIAKKTRKLTTDRGKLELSQFLVESELLVERAFDDGQPIDSVLYTVNYLSNDHGKRFLERVIQENTSCYQVNDGLMGSITTTRPVPSIIASIHINYPHFLTDSGELNFHYNKDCLLLIVENVSNPDNLGMIFRTADAAGISAILLCGEGASPFHKNTIRASRGAVGRIPMFHASNTYMAIEHLKEAGWHVIGATASGETDIYSVGSKSLTAVIVGNENSGLSGETRQQCSELVRIPMATGQSSLNVGVAVGILLYENIRLQRG